MDYIIYIFFFVFVLILLISLVGFFVRIKYDMLNWWYLRFLDFKGLYDFNRLVLLGFFYFVIVFILYGYLILILLYVLIEFVKFL